MVVGAGLGFGLGFGVSVVAGWGGGLTGGVLTSFASGDVGFGGWVDDIGGATGRGGGLLSTSFLPKHDRNILPMLGRLLQEGYNRE